MLRFLNRVCFDLGGHSIPAMTASAALKSRCIFTINRLRPVKRDVHLAHQHGAVRAYALGDGPVHDEPVRDPSHPLPLAARTPVYSQLAARLRNSGRNVLWVSLDGGGSLTSLFRRRQHKGSKADQLPRGIGEHPRLHPLDVLRIYEGGTLQPWHEIWQGRRLRSSLKHR